MIQTTLFDNPTITFDGYTYDPAKDGERLAEQWQAGIGTRYGHCKRYAAVVKHRYQLGYVIVESRVGAIVLLRHGERLNRAFGNIGW